MITVFTELLVIESESGSLLFIKTHNAESIITEQEPPLKFPIDFSFESVEEMVSFLLKNYKLQTSNFITGGDISKKLILTPMSKKSSIDDVLQNNDINYDEFLTNFKSDLKLLSSTLLLMGNNGYIDLDEEDEVYNYLYGNYPEDETEFANDTDQFKDAVIMELLSSPLLESFSAALKLENPDDQQVLCTRIVNFAELLTIERNSQA